MLSRGEFEIMILESDLKAAEEEEIFERGLTFFFSLICFASIYFNNLSKNVKTVFETSSIHKSILKAS